VIFLTALGDKFLSWEKSLIPSLIGNILVLKSGVLGGTSTVKLGILEGLGGITEEFGWSDEEILLLF
jgi:hypothetical protein